MHITLWSSAEETFLLLQNYFYFLHVCPPPLCDSFFSMIQLFTSCIAHLTKQNLYTSRHNRVCIGCSASARCMFTKHSIWSLPAVTRGGTCFSITVSALSSFLLDRALHSQVSSPRNSLTAGAGRVVTVMHGYTPHSSRLGGNMG